ncbi:MAG: TolC family protein [Prevotella sp.]|nr:TolC family protein [Prevotella sp.]
MKTKEIVSGFLLLAATMSASAQHGLDYFLVQARQNSPLIVMNRNQKAIDAEEMQRLKAAYTHSRLELAGDLLFVPIVSTDNGKTSFKMDAQSANSYYGYDLGQSSSHLTMGLNWVQPLTGTRGLRDAQELLRVNQSIADNNIQLTGHDLSRQVTEQYLLCQLDMANERSAREIDSLLVKQMDIVTRLANHGLTSPTDVQLLRIEQQANESLRQQAYQSYLTHRTELNTICGISDSASLAPVKITERLAPSAQSAFLEQYRLDSLQAQSNYRTYLNQYRPQLSLYASGGTQTGPYKDIYKRWGASAGLHFSWTLSDGKQLKNRQRQMEIQQNTIQAERQYAETTRQTRLSQLVQMLRSQDEQIANGQQQLDSYRNLLADYQKEIMAGRRSIVDYVNVFRNYRLQTRTLNELEINREILANTYNYWNW